MKILKDNLFFKYVILFLFVSSLYFSNISIVDANANIKWITTNVQLTAKKAIIQGYFYNSGDRGTTVKKVKLTLNTKTKKGDNIWSNVATYSDLRYGFVPAGGRQDYIFNMPGEGCPEWNGEFDYYVSWSIEYN